MEKDKDPEVARILAFLPAFERGDFENSLDEYMKTGTDLPLVCQFEAEVYGSGFVFPFDWAHWEEGRAMQLEDIDRADLLTLRKLLTAYVRNDRFSGGAMAKRCVDGSVLRVLRRLQALRDA